MNSFRKVIYLTIIICSTLGCSTSNKPSFKYTVEGKFSIDIPGDYVDAKFKEPDLLASFDNHDKKRLITIEEETFENAFPQIIRSISNELDMDRHKGQRNKYKVQLQKDKLSKSLLDTIKTPLPQPCNINGLSAFSGTLKGRSKNLQNVFSKIYVIKGTDSFYTISFFTLNDDLIDYQEEINKTVNSFKELK